MEAIYELIKKEAMQHYGRDNESVIDGIIERHISMEECKLQPLNGPESVIVCIMTRFEGDRNQDAKIGALENIIMLNKMVKETLDLIIRYDNKLKSDDCDQLMKDLRDSVYDMGINRIIQIIQPSIQILPISYISFGEDYNLSDIAFILTGFRLIKERNVDMIRALVGKK